MKIGMILECQPAGPDASVYPYVISKLCAALQIEKPETMNNKKALINDSAIVADTLVRDGCDYVFFIWDRHPRWSKDNPGNCDTDIAFLSENLEQARVPLERIVFCCIDQMMESWMIADCRGIDAWIATKTERPIRSFGDRKTKAEQSDPKNRIKGFLEEHFGKHKYNDYYDNMPIVKQLPDFERAATWNESFRYFKDSIEQICPQ